MIKSQDTQVKKRQENSTARIVTEKLRPEWRQRLVDAERGITFGIRLDSTFFIHFFSGSAVIAAAMLLGLSATHWAIILLAMTTVLSAQMFNQVLKSIWNLIGSHLPAESQNTFKAGTAAVCVSIMGSVITIAIVFCSALYRLLF
ncbi:MAG: diacylglycerol kinase family protein [Planctomycetes bacterium]|nr:diacylglycerol kinase family protein [Planctomycetota bacterium]MCH9727163.1 diacylglycerol kinase family protein [Planctomycetota bacterium]MCH9778556.1 diacylglycerol kinase family protein [Planctomycetota bacterium]MCH9791472.1 diacylglycerol kinase family protein [Planctomycetota bacterium]